MLNGSEVNGKVEEVSPSSVVLGRTGNYGYEETRIESKSIESLAWVKHGSFWPYLAAMVGGLAIWTAIQMTDSD